MTIDFARYSLDYCRRLSNNSVKTGAAGTHGAAGCPVSVRRRYPEGGVDSTSDTPSKYSEFPKN